MLFCSERFAPSALFEELVFMWMAVFYSLKQRVLVILAAKCQNYYLHIFGISLKMSNLLYLHFYLYTCTKTCLTLYGLYCANRVASNKQKSSCRPNLLRIIRARLESRMNKNVIAAYHKLVVSEIFVIVLLLILFCKYNISLFLSISKAHSENYGLWCTDSAFGCKCLNFDRRLFKRSVMSRNMQHEQHDYGCRASGGKCARTLNDRLHFRKLKLFKNVSSLKYINTFALVLTVSKILTFIFYNENGGQVP